MYAFERDIISFVYSRWGIEGKKVVKYLMKNSRVSDVKIVEATKIKDSIVRKILYDFHEAGMANYIKRRLDEGRNYEFEWYLDYRGCYNAMLKYYKEEIQSLEDFKSVVKSFDYYACSKPHHPRLTLDEAMEYDFKCPVCFELLHPVSHDDVLREIDERIKRLNGVISKIERHFKLYSRKG